MNNRSRFWLLIASVSIFLLALAPPTRTQSGAGGGQLRVLTTDIQSLDVKLQNFRGQLSPSEASAMNRLLLRAASDPSDDPRATIIKGSFFNLRGTGVFADENGDRGGGQPPGQRRVAATGGPGSILADQDREPNRPPPPPPESVNALKAALGAGTGAVAIGPKHDDPAPPPPETVNALSAKLQTFGGTLSGREKAVFNWLMDRASRSSGGTLRGGTPTLSQALGIAAFGSRAAAGGSTWLLSFN